MPTRSAAIFDLDGTLIPNTSAEKMFFWNLLRRGELSVINLFQMAAAVWYVRGNLHDMIRGNKLYLRRKHVEKIESIAQGYFEPQILKIVYPGMIEIIEQHRNQGDVLLLLTGTLDIIAECFVRELRFDGYKAGTLEIKHQKYTGRLNGILPYGVGKLEVFNSLVAEYGFDRDKTVLYANIYSDRYVMNAVTTPVAVNPDPKLRRYAKRMGWKTLDMSLKN